MDVPNRQDREAELQKALELVWTLWTSVEDPEQLREEDLVQLLRENCIDTVWAVWILANKNVLEEFGQQQDEKAAAIAFMFFFRSWVRDTVVRWKTRIAKKLYEEPANTQPTRPTYIGGGDGSGRTFVFDTLAGNQVVDPATGKKDKSRVAFEKLEQEPVSWPKARLEMYTREDADRDAITIVTFVHTNAEQAAVGKVQSAGKTIVQIWRTEPGACKNCAPLEGTRPNVWQKEAPKGPPYHPRCRCWLEHVAIEDT